MGAADREALFAGLRSGQGERGDAGSLYRGLPEFSRRLPARIPALQVEGGAERDGLAGKPALLRRAPGRKRLSGDTTGRWR